MINREQGPEGWQQQQPAKRWRGRPEPPVSAAAATFEGVSRSEAAQFKGLKLPHDKDKNKRAVRFNLQEDFDGEDDFNDDDVDNVPHHPLNKPPEPESS